MNYRTLGASALAMLLVAGGALAQTSTAPTPSGAAEGKSSPPGEAAGQPGGQGMPASDTSKKHHSKAKHSHKSKTM